MPMTRTSLVNRLAVVKKLLKDLMFKVEVCLTIFRLHVTSQRVLKL